MGKPVIIVLEAENFSNGWVVLPVVVDNEESLKQAVKTGFRNHPEMSAWSAGRYRYSGTKLTGLYPVADVEFQTSGEYVLWVRSKFYSEKRKGRYLVEIGDWRSTEFGGYSETGSETWEWQKDIFKISAPGAQTVRLREFETEACCDVLVLTNDKDLRPEGVGVPSPEWSQDAEVIRIPYTEGPACERAVRDGVEIFKFDHGRTMSYHGYFGDLDDDGKDEVILPFEDNYLEAFKYDGTSLWKCDVEFLWHKISSDNYREKGFNHFIPHDFRPNKRDGAGSHIIDYCRIADIDRDGRQEFIFGWNPLYVIDARTGQIKHERMLPGQAARLDLADILGSGRKEEILAVTKDAVEGRAFVHALDRELNTIWQTRVEGPDVEHMIAVGDIDGDGKDEIAFTCSHHLYCVDHDGKISWVLQGCKSWGGMGDHSDRLLIADLDEKISGQTALILCEGNVFNADGTLRWNAGRQFDHGQTVAVAKIRDDYPGKQILFGERNIGNLYCYSAGGDLIWQRGRYNGERVHTNDIVPINWSGRGMKEILCRYLGIFDAQGNLVKIPPFMACGSSNLCVADMLGDSRDEIIVTVGTTTYVIANASRTK